MEQQYDNTNRGALFKNQDKEEDSHPDYRGQINVDGTEYWISAWLKTSKKGDKFMSLSVKPKEQRQQARQQRGGNVRDMPDDIPFAPIGKWL